jgi:PKD repeat protein
VATPISCNANFGYQIDSLNPRLVDFIDSSTFQAPSGSFTDTVFWDFGDGSPIERGSSVSHTYSSAQTYTACLTINVYDSLGNIVCTNSTCKQITIIPDTGFCNVSYIIDTVNSYPGNVYIWNMSNPANNDPNFINRYFWDFGDGSSSTQAYPIHNYAVPGSYNLCLTLTSTNQNLDSCVSTFCDSIVVDVNGNLNGINTNGFVLRVLNPETISLFENSLKATNIYPNPANGYLNLEFSNKAFGNINWSIKDLKGALIQEGQRKIRKEEIITIDVSTIKTGMYIISIENEFSVYHHKLEINRW